MRTCAWHVYVYSVAMTYSWGALAPRQWGYAHHAVLDQRWLELRELLGEALEVVPTRLARHDKLVPPD